MRENISTFQIDNNGTWIHNMNTERRRGGVDEGGGYLCVWIVAKANCARWRIAGVSGKAEAALHNAVNKS